jgi:hypothetical protein
MGGDPHPVFFKRGMTPHSTLRTLQFRASTTKVPLEKRGLIVGNLKMQTDVYI